MKYTPQTMLAIGVIPAWVSVALIGFVAYHNAGAMKYFLAMNFLALAYTLIVLGSWVRTKLSE